MQAAEAKRTTALTRRERVRVVVAQQESRRGRITAGYVDLEPIEVHGPDGTPRSLCYRLKLVRDPVSWRVITERSAADWPAGKRPRTSDESFDLLGDARYEVQSQWGVQVWLGLLKASAETLQAIAPLLIEHRAPQRMPAAV